MNRRRVLVVVSDPRDAAGLPAGLAVDADRYLEGRGGLDDPRAVVVNLSRSTRYGSRGYYVSLLADARRQQVIPSVETSVGLQEPYGRFRALQEAGVPTIDAAEMRIRRRELDLPPAEKETEGEGEEAPRRDFPIPLVRGRDGGCRPARGGEYAEALVYLGTCADPRFQRAALAVYREWPAPVLRLQLVEEDEEWKVTQVAAVPPHHLAPDERAELVRALCDPQRVLRRGRESPRETVRASIAVLVDPADPFSPSSPETIERLERVAARQNVHVARIGLGDMRKLPEYDALFIRALTGVSEPSFQFALRAEALDMPVVDDPQSIIRCGNKVFLEELLRREGVATPRTLIVTQTTPWQTVEALGLPFVIKLPDGSFSAAVHKIGSREEFRRRSREMFARSPLLIAQEFLPTQFDWRVTVLGGRLLFASRYYMARGHWQIRTEVKGTERYGKVEAIPRGQAPEEVVRAALRAASLIGGGLYGVDLKETDAGPVVIEINDNPNLDVGYEDAEDGNAIYEDIVGYFVQHIEEGAPLPADADGGGEEPALASIRTPVRVKTRGENGSKGYRAFEVAGMELEYATVDRDLNVVSLVEPAFRILAGRGTSDVHLGALGFSNEIADHVFEVKTSAPVRSLRQAEEVLYEGIQRFTAVLRDEFDARLMPTGMHPWFDPAKGRLWARSGGRIYGTYEQLFDVRTHGWMNVQASHLNLPFGNERETLAMHTAAALLVPYLPAIGASTPMYEGDLRPHADSRLAWILEHQARIPESCGQLVPEYVDSFADYRKKILGPMYAALDRFPQDTSAIRHDFLNARGAVFKFSRRAMEVRVLDTQECVKMDAAIAAFVRAALKDLTRRVLAGKIELPPHELLVEDFRATIRDGSAAVVTAPHVAVERDETGRTDVRAVLRALLAGARKTVRKDEAPYLELIARVIECGSLSECIRAALRPHEAGSDEDFTEAARRVYIELMDCLEANEPWRGRGL